VLSLLLLAASATNLTGVESPPPGDPRPALASEADPDVDSDGDGLSDFEEVHKYFTDPRLADSDGDGIPDGDWDERREYAYTVRTIVRVLPPVTEDVLSDDYQDARVIERTPGYVELEVIHYPLNTVADAIRPDPDWRAHATRMSAWTSPGRTATYDPGMRRELLGELASDGIDATRLDDQALAERASRWLLSRAKFVDGFTTFCSWFPNGKVAVYPGLETAVERGIADKSLSLADQWDRELFAQGMFENRVRGSCTSSAIYLSGCLRALGLPTRIVLGIPCVDPSDPSEVAMARSGITHKGVRRILLQAIEGQAGMWVSHTFDEVFVGGRWRRLNYGRLGQNILDPQYLGLMTHVATFADWADGEMARTWGVRQAVVGPHDDTFRGPNPYSALAVSDRFGVHAEVKNELLLGPDEFATLTIERAYGWNSPERKVEMDLRGEDPAGHFLVHVREGKTGAKASPYKAFWSACGKEFRLSAKGETPVRAHATRGYWAEPEKGIQEFHFAIEPAELAKMKRGVAYELAPVEQDEDFRWTVADGVTLVRP
jgi:hypothetical protein